MPNTTPVLGRNASITLDGASIGYLKGISFDIDAEVIKDYKFTSDLPAVLESGNKTIKFSFQKLYIDSVYAADVLAGTKVVSLLIGPANSTPIGQPKYTLGNAIIFHSGFRAEQGGIVIEDGSGEAATLTINTYT